MEEAAICAVLGFCAAVPRPAAAAILKKSLRSIITSVGGVYDFKAAASSARGIFSCSPLEKVFT
ncbi:MAG TPA: hypothetical protein VIM60_04220, partial [Edaphobacter sp.]